jgi:hypothetical protein
MRPPIYLPDFEPIKIDASTALVLAFFVVFSILAAPAFLVYYFARHLWAKSNPETAAQKLLEKEETTQSILENDPAHWIYTR